MAFITKSKPISVVNPTGDRSTLASVVRTISNHILFPAIGRTDPNIILEGCVALSCCNTSISGFGKMHNGLPSHTTCLNTLHQLDLEELMSQSSAILAEPAMKVLKKGRSYSFAIDKTDIPYYGDREGKYAPYVVGGKRKASTNYFYAYMTIVNGSVKIPNYGRINFLNSKTSVSYRDIGSTNDLRRGIHYDPRNCQRSRNDRGSIKHK